MAGPSVSSISPTAGPIGGGTVVTILGANFAGAVAVTFGATPAASYVVNTANQITLVTVRTASGSSGQPVFFSFQVPAVPLVTGVAPGNGPASGGTTVVLTGTRFTGATAVKFGAAPAAAFTVDSDTQITAVAPPGTGVALVTALGPGGTSAAAYYSYLPAPVVTGLAPAQGPESGGNEVTVIGSGLGLALVVTFGAVPVSFVAYSDALLGAVAPPGTGVVPVAVTTPGGPSAGAPYTYVSPP